MKKQTKLFPKSKLITFITLIFAGLLCFSLMPNYFGLKHSHIKAQSSFKQYENTAVNYNYSSLLDNLGLDLLEENTEINSVGFKNTAPGEITLSFSGYGNPQRPFPGYLGTFQLGPVKISGSGVIRAKDGKLLKGGSITHSDNLRDKNYPRHSTKWQIVRGLDVNKKSGVTVLRLLVKVVSSNYKNICPVGTQGVLTLTDDNRRMNNKQTRDGIKTQMPNPFSKAADGGAACRTHVHGMNNISYSWTDPRFGGPGGGNWANVNINVEASNSGSVNKTVGRYRHFANSGINGSFDFNYIFKNTTVRKCSVECNKYGWCKSFEYIPSRRLCYLYRGSARKSKRGVDVYIKQ